MIVLTKSLLIDGDIFLYQVASAVEEPTHWGDDIWTLHSDMRTAREVFDMEIKKLQKRLNVKKVVIALSDPDRNWRRSVLHSYKANRRGNRKPVVYVPLREHAAETYETVWYPTLEADDVLGLLATEDTIIVSDDKDLKTIPGTLYVPYKDELLEVTQENADRYHLVQTLTGDSVDGYKGCPGIGPKKAEKVLEEGTWDEVVEAYEKAGLSESVALVQARVARILRSGEYNYKTKEVNLWKPT
jgi:DNA polymerase-1